jgi:ubiquinone/menaquinone biosynthesis C-methylase UbiE
MPKKHNEPNVRSQYRRPVGEVGRKVAAQMNEHHEQLTTWGLSHVTVQPNFTVLDVGSGGGKTVSRLAELACKGKVYGADYSSDMVAFAKEVNSKLIAEGHVEIVEASVEKTGFPEGYFDLVTAVETYYFWPDLPAAFAEVSRILKPGGKLLLINEMLIDGEYEVENAKLIEETHVHLVPLPQLAFLILSCGFTDVNVFVKANTPWNAVIATK